VAVVILHSMVSCDWLYTPESGALSSC